MKVRTLNPTSIAAAVVMGSLVACGSVGPPIAPEKVGVTPTIERQKQLETLEEKKRGAAVSTESSEPQPELMLQGQDVDLPPLQPVGTR